MNHARTTTAIHGVMNSLEYDPVRGYASVPAEKLDRNFDAYEM